MCVCVYVWGCTRECSALRGTGDCEPPSVGAGTKIKFAARVVHALTDEPSFQPKLNVFIYACVSGGGLLMPKKHT